MFFAPTNLFNLELDEDTLLIESISLDTLLQEDLGELRVFQQVPTMYQKLFDEKSITKNGKYASVKKINGFLGRNSKLESINVPQITKTSNKYLAYVLFSEKKPLIMLWHSDSSYGGTWTYGKYADMRINPELYEYYRVNLSDDGKTNHNISNLTYVNFSGKKAFIKDYFLWLKSHGKKPEIFGITKDEQKQKIQDEREKQKAGALALIHNRQASENMKKALFTKLKTFKMEKFSKSLNAETSKEELMRIAEKGFPKHLKIDFMGRGFLYNLRGVFNVDSYMQSVFTGAKPSSSPKVEYEQVYENYSIKGQVLAQQKELLSPEEYGKFTFMVSQVLPNKITILLKFENMRLIPSVVHYS